MARDKLGNLGVVFTGRLFLSKRIFSRYGEAGPMRKDKRRQRPISLAAPLSEGQVVRSLTCLVVLVACFPAVPGCAIFNKKSTDSKTPAAGTGGAAAPAKFPTSSDPLINGGNAAQSYGGAVLAGRVFDNYSRPPANTSIRLVSMDGKETA